VLELLRKSLRPEFLNRIDEIVIFSHLEKSQLRDIIGQYITKLNGMLKERGLSLDFAPAAIDWLGERGYDRDFGARPMKRVFQREVQNRLALEILGGAYPPGTRVRVEVQDGGLKFVPGV
jgi:ATP-dependent Clp protease ATP-binding subunit ClpA